MLVNTPLGIARWNQSALRGKFAITSRDHGSVSVLPSVLHSTSSTVPHARVTLYRCAVMSHCMSSQ